MTNSDFEIECGVDKWPKVRIEVRERIDVGQERAESEWPLARTKYRPFYLYASGRALNPESARKESSTSYDSTSAEPQALFAHTFDRDTELTGYFKLDLIACGSRSPMDAGQGL